jgi:ribosomal protein S26
LVPRDKAVEKVRHTLRLSRGLRELLKKRGAYISSGRRTVHYCVSCAKHRKYV